MLEQPAENSTTELETLLSAAKLNEKRARKRAVWYTLIPLALGTAFLGVSLYKVLRLEQRATSLNHQITAQIGELETRQKDLAELEERKKSVDDKLAVATTTLTDIDKGKGDPQQKARTALRLISRDAKISSEQNGPTTQSSSESVSRVLTLVPNLIGKSFKEAYFELPRLNLQYAGHLEDWKAAVIRQDPVPGTKVRQGTEVHLWVEPSIVVPDVRGKTYREALHYFDVYKLRFDGVIPSKSATVIKQNPDPGTKVTAGTKIHLSFGPSPVPSP